MELIKVKENEYASLYGLMQPIWIDTFSSIIPHAQIELLLKKYFDEKNIREFLARGYQYNFIFSDGKKAGLLVYVDKGNEIYVDKLYVLNECRGTGCSSFALGEIKKLGKDLTLNVNRNNSHAITVYKHLGFTVEKEIDIELEGGMINRDYYMRLKSNS